jgi:hypothetical protein
MRWSKHGIRNSLYALLGAGTPDNSHTPAADLDDLRTRMADSLGGSTIRLIHVGLRQRILTTHDPMGLWYLRTQLMQALCERCGESEARALMDDLTRRFRGLVPGAMMRSHSNGPPRLRG